MTARVAGAGHHHPEPVSPQEGHGVELDRQGLGRLVDGLPELGDADGPGVESAVAGIEHDCLLTIPLGRSIGHTRTGGEGGGSSACDSGAL